MPDIPSFFDKVSFFGTLLPGYLAITLYLLLFRPELLFTPGQALNFDLFSAIVFVIAGPAIGLALLQLHRRLYVIGDWIRMVLTKTDPDDRFDREFSHVQLSWSAAEKLELTEALVDYDFSMSSGLAFLLVGAYHLLVKGSVDLAIPMLLFVLAVVFILGGHLERIYTYTPLVDELFNKYPLQKYKSSGARFATHVGRSRPR